MFVNEYRCHVIFAVYHFIIRSKLSLSLLLWHFFWSLSNSTILLDRLLVCMEEHYLASPIEHQGELLQRVCQHFSPCHCQAMVVVVSLLSQPMVMDILLINLMLMQHLRTSNYTGKMITAYQFWLLIILWEVHVLIRACLIGKFSIENLKNVYFFLFW